MQVALIGSGSLRRDSKSHLKCFDAIPTLDKDPYRYRLAAVSSNVLTKVKFIFRVHFSLASLS